MIQRAANFPFNPGRSPRLVVNADDFGISEAVNGGIVRAHLDGIVTATSLMAVGRAFDHAVRLCRETPTLDIGAHLTLVAEKPFLKTASSLAGTDGRFPEGVSKLSALLLKKRIKLPDVEAEWSAQIERILESGIRVTHLDSHQHVHALPGLAKLTAELASHYRIPFVRVPIADRVVARPLTKHRLFRTAGAIALAGSCVFSQLGHLTAGPFQPLRFLGFHEGGRLNTNSLKQMLRTLHPGKVYELMCHPGFTPPEADLKAWHYSHRRELEALLDPSIRSYLADRDIRLCSFAELARI